MSMVKQEIYKARKDKNKELQLLLSKIVIASMKESSCIAYEVYQSDEDNHEFLVYSEFEDKDSYEIHNKTAAKAELDKKFEEFVLRKELLPEF